MQFSAHLLGICSAPSLAAKITCNTGRIKLSILFSELFFSSCTHICCLAWLQNRAYLENLKLGKLLVTQQWLHSQSMLEWGRNPKSLKVITKPWGFLYSHCFLLYQAEAAHVLWAQDAEQEAVWCQSSPSALPWYKTNCAESLDMNKRVILPSDTLMHKSFLAVAIASTHLSWSLSLTV